MSVILKSPYPYFGGKSAISDLIWSRFGDVRNFVDPFMGSLAMLLGRPTPFEGMETVNDADGMIPNFGVLSRPIRKRLRITLHGRFLSAICMLDIHG
jgi:hypothetical protein